jgi:hypothetical protein
LYTNNSVKHIKDAVRDVLVKMSENQLV